MLFFNQKTRSHASDFKRSGGFLLGVTLVILGFIFSSESIRAQIKSLYDDNSDQVAGISSLMSAVTSNDIEGVKFFSKAGSALINQKNAGGASALHLACREKNLQIVQLLIESGANVNLTDNEGWTPLMRASLSGNFAIVNLLLEKNAEANILNSIGESAIIHATSSDCSQCLAAMFEKFNFIKLMEFELLKAQLGSAYKIAQNHENKAAQDIISAYLDRSVKMSSLIEADEPISEGLNVDENEKVTTATPMSDSGKKFKFTSSENEIKKVDQVNKVSLQKKDLPNVTSLEEPKANNSGKIIYKFAGQQKSFEAQKMEAQSIYKFKAAKAVNKKGKGDYNQNVTQPKPIVDSKPVDSSDQKINHSKPNKFKFKQGEPAKINSSAATSVEPKIIKFKPLAKQADNKQEVKNKKALPSKENFKFTKTKTEATDSDQETSFGLY